MQDKNKQNMKCLICKAEAEFFFSKRYNEEPFKSFMEEIGEVQYYKCPNCGFTMSKTHYEMDTQQWEKLNLDYHTYSEKKKSKSQKRGELNPPPYLDQAVLLKTLSTNNIIDTESILDFAGGHGTLSKIVDKYFNISLPIYDPYMNEENGRTYISKEDLKVYKSVINSALFEHITSREDLEEINQLVDQNGCMIIHSVIAENIPNDVNWFYIKIPVHCTFHTNRSMEILMEQWGYKCSLYCPISKCWILFKLKPENIKEKIEAINKEFQAEYLIYKDGFVDFWKGFN